MKKIKYIMVAFIISLTLVGCGSSSGDKLSNTKWTAKSAEYEETTIKGDDLKDALGGKATLEFKEDGVVVLTINAKTGNGTYEIKDDEVIIKSGKTYKTNYNSQKITLKIDDVKITFKKD